MPLPVTSPAKNVNAPLVAPARDSTWSVPPLPTRTWRLEHRVDDVDDLTGRRHDADRREDRGRADRDHHGDDVLRGEAHDEASRGRTWPTPVPALSAPRQPLAATGVRYEYVYPVAPRKMRASVPTSCIANPTQTTLPAAAAGTMSGGPSNVSWVTSFIGNAKRRSSVFV